MTGCAPFRRAILRFFPHGITLPLQHTSKHLWKAPLAPISLISTIGSKLKICNMLQNPTTISNTVLTDINYNYHTTLRWALIVIEYNILIYHVPIVGGNSYTNLILVPESFKNILFIAFHTNALGGHFNEYHALHCLHLCYCWPGIYSYAKRMRVTCLGCALSNPTKSKSSKLVYKFPIEAPFLVLALGLLVDLK